MAALEEYAIEASISKILGSETPVPRVGPRRPDLSAATASPRSIRWLAMFRNTRIDRIWEGTNEINRMVIYGYYLKKALMEELPLRGGRAELE